MKSEHPMNSLLLISSFIERPKLLLSTVTESEIATQKHGFSGSMQVMKLALSKVAGLSPTDSRYQAAWIPRQTYMHSFISGSITRRLEIGLLFWTILTTVNFFMRLRNSETLVEMTVLVQEDDQFGLILAKAQLVSLSQLAEVDR